MAFPTGPFGNGVPEPTGQQPPSSSPDVEKLSRELAEMNQKFEAQRNLLLTSQATSSQQLDLLRKQLSETVSRQHGPEPQQQAPQTDDWMSFLANSGQQPSQPAAPPQQKPLTADEVRRIYQEEEHRKQVQHSQEVQKVDALNARFAVEHPELAKDPNAVALIRNQFLALANLRPDLPAEQRYQFAIDNVVKDVLPNLQMAPKEPRQTQAQPKQQPANPYMPNVFAAPPGRGNVQEIMGMVDTTPMEQKFANREKELLNWQKNRNKSFFGG